MKLSDAVFPRMIFDPAAAAPSAAAGQVQLYAKVDGLLYFKDANGVEYPATLLPAVAAALRDRTTHTGMQSVQSVTGAAALARGAGRASSVMSDRRAVSPFLANIAQQPTSAYGMVKMRADYTGPCMKIQRSADSAQLDIGFMADGVIDTDAIYAFQNGTAAPSAYIYVTTLYDQMTAANHMTQATTSAMPQLDLTYLRNGMPAIYCGSGRTMAIPTTLAIAATNNCSVFAAIGNYSPRTGGMPWALGTSGQFDFNLAPGTAWSVQVRAAATALQYTEGGVTLANSNGCVVGVNSLSTELRYFRNNTSYTRAAVTAGQTLATTGGTLCPTGPVDMYGLVIYGTGLTRADASAIQGVMSRAYRCVFNFDKQIVFVGDSTGAGAFDYSHNYNKELWNYIPLETAIYNVSLSGQRVTGAGGQASDVADRAVRLFKTGIFNLGVNNGGVNDITALVSAADTLAGLVTWHSSMKNAGFTTLQALLYNRVVTGAYTDAMRIEREALNAAIRANTGVGKSLGVDVIDYNLEAQMMPTILAKYFPDNLHPNQAGYVLLTPYLASAIYANMPAG